MNPALPHPSWIEVDLAQFRKNLAAIRRKIGKRLFCLPVKANAYGHGMQAMAQIAQESGVDCLGVACLKEAVVLRRSGLTLPIFVFGALHEEQIPDLIEGGFEFSISSRYKAELVAAVCEKKKNLCRIHLEVDTGMQRTGVRPESALELFAFLRKNPYFCIAGIYSHLATADQPGDSFAKKQIEAFQILREKIQEPKLLWHLANSGGVAFYPHSYFDMVRPGILSYGYFPNGSSDPSGEIAPCLSLKSKISYFKVVAAGEGVSYGHQYRTQRQTRVVTVPIGYGDGYPRALSNKAPVLIRGKRFSISGAICMDQFMVDIGTQEAYVGDTVTLIGREEQEEIRLAELAQLAGTIPYEILVNLNERLTKVYTGSGCTLLER